ncbi:MAG: sodium:calcium antiporter [Bacillota bacterium]
MINPWIQFFICAALIVFAGSKLTRNAAIISEKTGIGSAWIGALLLALATSLPELVTTLSAVAINTPDLALGNILGSCLFNLALLAVMDLVSGKGPLTSIISQGHIITASLSILTICFAALALLGFVYVSVGWVGFETILIALVYITGSRLVFRYERRNPVLVAGSEEIFKACSFISSRQALINFALATGLIIITGVFITSAADRIAMSTGLGHTLIGTILLAISTSLPETVTTLTAVRLGYVDMAVATIFGSNFMNMLVVFIADLFYRQAPLLHVVSSSHLASAIMVIIITIIVIFSLIYKSEKKLGRIGYDMVLVLAGYFMAAFLLYRSGGTF